VKRREEKVRELKWREGAVTRKKKGRGENRKKVEERRFFYCFILY